MKNATSFAMKVKEELTRIERSEAAKRSLLSGYAKSQGLVRINSSKLTLNMSSEISSVTKLLYSYLRDLYGVTPYFSYSKTKGLGKGVRYALNLDDAGLVLGDLEMDVFDQSVPLNLTKTKEQATAYITGVFLSSGSVNSPSTSNYHLEMGLENEEYAKNVSRLFNHRLPLAFQSRVCPRRREWVVYIKKGESIADFLALLGASETTLEFEDARVERDMRNIENRLDNLDGANMGKTLKTGRRQVEEIEYFILNGGISQFDNEKIEKLLLLRLEHEDASLEELAHLLSGELNTQISKSNVNHLFRKLHQEYLSRSQRK